MFEILELEDKKRYIRKEAKGILASGLERLYLEEIFSQTFDVYRALEC